MNLCLRYWTLSSSHMVQSLICHYPKKSEFDFETLRPFSQHINSATEGEDRGARRLDLSWDWQFLMIRRRRPRRERDRAGGSTMFVGERYERSWSDFPRSAAGKKISGSETRRFQREIAASSAEYKGGKVSQTPFRRTLLLCKVVEKRWRQAMINYMNCRKF